MKRHTIDGKLQVISTIRLNLPAPRRTLKQTIDAHKRASRDARLVQILTR